MAVTKEVSFCQLRKIESFWDFRESHLRVDVFHPQMGCLYIYIYISLWNRDHLRQNNIFIYDANDEVALVPSKVLTKTHVSDSPFSYDNTYLQNRHVCKSSWIFAFLLTNVTKAIFVYFVFVRAFFAHFMYDT